MATKTGKLHNTLADQYLEAFLIIQSISAKKENHQAMAGRSCQTSSRPIAKSS